MVNYNYFGSIPYNYRYIVSMELRTPESHPLSIDANNNCPGCTGNDGWTQKYENINDDTTNRELKANQWNIIYITYDNYEASANPNNREVTDWTGFRLNTNSEITYKVRNVQYTYVPR